MDGTVVLAAMLPVPPSTNGANKRNKWGGVYKDESVVTFREKVFNMINFHGRTLEPMPFAPYFVDDLNWQLIEVQRYAFSKRTKECLALRKKWRIVAHVFVNEDRRDADNCAKELQDAVFKAISLNDKCVSDFHITLIVDREAEPHTAIVMREDLHTWKPGDLLNYVRMERQLGEQYNIENSGMLDSKRRIYSL